LDENAQGDACLAPARENKKSNQYLGFILLGLIHFFIFNTFDAPGPGVSTKTINPAHLVVL
jgi:hypothetical protein